MDLQIVKYKFEITFAHQDEMKIDVDSTQPSPIFFMATGTMVVELSFFNSPNPAPSLEDVKQTIITTFQEDLNMILKVEGSLVD